MAELAQRIAGKRSPTCFLVLILAGCVEGPRKELQQQISEVREEARDSETVSLVGFRELDPDLVIIQAGDDPQEQVAGLPEDLFLEAAKSSESVRAALKKAGKEERTAGLKDWFTAAQTVATSRQWQAKAVLASKPISFKLPQSSKPGLADTDFLIGLTASELFSATPDQPVAVTQIGTGGNKVVAIRLDPTAATTFKSAYETLRSDENTAAWKWTTGAASCASQLNANPLLSSNAKVEMGKITFGKPCVYTAQSKKITISEALEEESSVYWLDLVLTIRDLESEIETLTFRAHLLPSTAISLALVPDLQEKLSVQESPGSGLAQSLEPQIQLEPHFKNLKPKIVPGGLRENKLFWTMSSTAIARTSYSFVAIVQVPAEIEAIDVTLSVEGTLKKKFLVRKGVVTTEHPVTQRILLRAKPR